MNVTKFVVAGVAVGVVLNVFDFLVHGVMLMNTYAALPNLFRVDAPIPWLVFGDFVAAFVFVWVYDRVYRSFPPGAAGGATFGFYAGVLIIFPTAIFYHLLFVGFPYSLSWTWTVIGIAYGVVAGGVAGALYRK